MAEQLHYKFAGTDGLVDLSGCNDVAGFLPSLFQSWPFEQARTETRDQEMLFKVSRTREHYHLSSPIFDVDQNLKDPLNIACSLVAQLAWAQLRQNPQMLCFHGAAIEVDGALVLFPNKKRAGKSTLTACLAALGYRIFTDDYLPIKLEENGVMYGYANGAAPRLRLPLPNEFSPTLVSKLKAMSGPSNKQYLYLNPEEGTLADHGERLPISTIVLLDREEGKSMELTNASSAKILRRVILQNFSRHMNPARILGMIDHLVESTRGLELRYESAEFAAAFLSKTLSDALPFDAADAYRGSPELVSWELCLAESVPSFDPEKHFVRSENVIERDHETDCFLASTQGVRIHHLDLLARAIWKMLQEPTKLGEIADIFKAAFPDQLEDALRHDIAKTLAMFAKEGLLVQSE